MPSKSFTLDDEVVITVYKRRGNRHLRLSINASGQVKVSIPTWAPYKAGVDFARSRHDWIIAQASPPPLLKHGQAIGKAHHLNFSARLGTTRVSSQTRGNTITISYPPDLDALAPSVQQSAHRAAIRSLRAQAQQLLPQRLADLAAKHGFEYAEVSIKQMSGRWGSCDQRRRIVLNLYLMQLPWDLIDYVLLHELAHTQVLRHGPDFWQAMESVLPQAKDKRRQLKAYRPILATE